MPEWCNTSSEQSETSDDGYNPGRTRPGALVSERTHPAEWRGIMAKKGKGARIQVTMKSTESSHRYLTEKNRRNNTSRLELRKFDPVLRRHVIYRESR